MRCFHCQHDNPLEMRFCGACGEPLRVSCGACSATVPYARFCGNCGVPLQPPQARGVEPSVAVAAPVVQPSASPTSGSSTRARPVAVDTLHDEALEKAVSGDAPTLLAEKFRAAGNDMIGERRKVAVLFSDVSGFTAMSEKMDPEQIHEIMNECFEGLVKIIYKYEGYIDKFIGDAIMTLFGAPLAHEDDVARALFAIIEMTEWLDGYSETLNERFGVTLGMHSGLNYGSVIAGGLGSDLRMDYTVIGDTVNVASRLEGAAERGQTFVSETVYAVGRRQFDFREVEPLTLKGKSKPVSAFEVLGVRDDPEPLRGVEEFETVLVGRDDQLAQLNAAFDRTLAGEGQVVSVIGEPGAGKSRLSAEFRLDRADERARTLQFACLSYTTKTPYYLFRGILANWLDLEETDPANVVSVKLRAAFDSLDANLDDWDVYLRSVLVSMDEEDAAALANLDAQTRQRLTDRAIVETLRAVARRQPLILLCDDLHWLDESSARVLNMLATQTANTPMLLLAVYRQEFDPDWSALPNWTRIPIHVLDAAATRELIGALLNAPDLPDAFLNLIARQSAGNPYFVEEILRAFVDDGALVRDGGSWKLARSPDDVQAPESLHAVIMGRIDNTPEECRGLLQTASVVGRTFDCAILGELGWPLAQTAPHLEYLTSLQLLIETRALPDLQHTFKQEFIQEVCYETLLHKSRRETHGRVADAIERLFADRIKEHVEQMVHHSVHAEDWRRALDYAKRSAEKARELYANASALDYYRQVLDLAERIEEDGTEARVFAYEGLGDILSLTGQYDEAIEAYEHILDALEAADANVKRAGALRSIGNVYSKRGDAARALEFTNRALETLGDDASDDATRERAKLTGQVGFIRFRQGRYDEAREISRESYECARRIGADPEAAYANLVWGLSSYNQGDLDDAVQRYHTSLELRERIGDVNGVAAVLQNLGNAHLDRAEYAEAQRVYQRCHEIRVKVGDVAGQANVLNQLGNARLNQGDDNGAATYYEECLDIFERIGNRFGVAVATLNIGQIENERDEFARARDYLQRALDAAEPLKAADLIADIQTGLARANAELGDLDAAETLVGAALSAAREIGNQSVEGKALWTLGRARHIQGDLDAATERYTDALAIFADLNMRLWLGRSRLARARVHMDNGNIDNARSDLLEAETLFSEQKLQRDATRAQELLRQLDNG